MANIWYIMLVMGHNASTCWEDGMEQQSETVLKHDSLVVVAIDAAII